MDDRRPRLHHFEQVRLTSLAERLVGLTASPPERPRRAFWPPTDLDVGNYLLEEAARSEVTVMGRSSAIAGAGSHQEENMRPR